MMHLFQWSSQPQTTAFLNIVNGTLSSKPGSDKKVQIQTLLMFLSFLQRELKTNSRFHICSAEKVYVRILFIYLFAEEVFQLAN